MSWYFKNKLVTTKELPEGSVGFVYKITHLPTNKFYIGKKSLTQRRTLPPLKGKKRKRRVVKESDWEKYYSSNEWIKLQVKEGKSEEFRREIIQFCKSKKSLSYWELYWQFKYDVLSDKNAINENISGKWFRKDLQ